MELDALLAALKQKRDALQIALTTRLAVVGDHASWFMDELEGLAAWTLALQSWLYAQFPAMTGKASTAVDVLHTVRDRVGTAYEAFMQLLNNSAAHGNWTMTTRATMAGNTKIASDGTMTYTRPSADGIEIYEKAIERQRQKDTQYVRCDVRLAVSHIDAVCLIVAKNRAMIAKAAKGDAGDDAHYG